MPAYGQNKGELSMSYDYEIFWKDKASHDFEYGACRAKNLAEEIIVGWTDQTDLHGFEHILTTHALEHFGEMIDGGFTQAKATTLSR